MRRLSAVPIPLLAFLFGLFLIVLVPSVIFAKNRSNSQVFAKKEVKKTIVNKPRVAKIAQATAKEVPNPTPSPTPSPSPTPTPTPQVLSVSATPSPTPQASSANTQSSIDAKSFIMNAINAYRASNGLSAVQTNSETCGFAKIRAQEISQTFNHDGFRSRIDAKSLPYPSYSQVTENIAMNGKYSEVVNSWINSPGHAENMRKDTPYICVESHNNYYAYEGLRL